MCLQALLLSCTQAAEKSSHVILAAAAQPQPSPCLLALPAGQRCAAAVLPLLPPEQQPRQPAPPAAPAAAAVPPAAAAAGLAQHPAAAALGPAAATNTGAVNTRPGLDAGMHAPFNSRAGRV